MATAGGAARTSDKRARRRHSEHPACDLYVPGHLVHFIQAKKAWESDDPVRWGRFDRVDDDGVLTVRFLDGARHYRVHRPSEIARVAEPGDKVRVSERWRLATVSRRFEQLLTVCIALPDDPWRSCGVASDEPRSFDDLADHLAERGGFVVPGRAVTRLLGPASEEEDGGGPDGELGDVS